MKVRDLKKQLKLYGWYFHRHGGNHDIWTNGRDRVSVPRHKEVKERLALEIIAIAKTKEIK